MTGIEPYIAKGKLLLLWASIVVSVFLIWQVFMGNWLLWSFLAIAPIVLYLLSLQRPKELGSYALFMLIYVGFELLFSFYLVDVLRGIPLLVGSFIEIIFYWAMLMVAFAMLLEVIRRRRWLTMLVALLSIVFLFAPSAAMIQKAGGVTNVAKGDIVHLVKLLGPHTGERLTHIWCVYIEDKLGFDVVSTSDCS